MQVIIYILLIGIIIITSLYIYLNKIQQATFKNFKQLRSILEYHCQQAYDSIYKSKILVYSINGTKLVGKELDDLKKEYYNLTLKLMGPKLTKSLKDVYGKALIFNIIMYFENKYDEDEIYRATLNNFKQGMNIDAES